MEPVAAGGVLRVTASAVPDNLSDNLPEGRGAGLPREHLLRAVALASLLTPLNSTMIAVALPAVRAQFHVGVGSLTWLISSYLIIVAVTQPIGGQLGDALGHLRVVRWGLLLLVACSFAAAFAWSFPSLVAARALQGVTAGLISPNVTAFLRKQMPPGRLGSALGSNGAAVATGAAIGPILGGFLLAAGDWRLLFLANVPLGLIALLLVLTLRSDRGAGRSALSIDAPSVAALAGVFTGATLIGTAIQHPGPLVIAAATCLLPLSASGYALSYWRRGMGVVKLALFSRRNYWASAAGVSLSNLVQYTILLAMPLYLSSERALGSARIGLMLFPMSGVTVGISPLAGRLADRMGSKPVMVGGAGALLSAAALLSGALGQLPLPALAAALALAGFGVGVQQVAQQAAALEAWPPQLAGAAAGTLSMMRYVGSVIGAAIVATLLGVNPHLAAFQLLLLVVAGFGVANLGITFALRRRSSETGPLPGLLPVPPQAPPLPENS